MMPKIKFLDMLEVNLIVIFENEIRKQSWKISENLQIERMNIKRFYDEEQECHFNIIKLGENELNKPEIIVDCTYLKYIEKLARRDSFTLTRVTLSCKKPFLTGGQFIIGIQGKIPIEKLIIK